MLCGCHDEDGDPEGGFAVELPTLLPLLLALLPTLLLALMSFATCSYSFSECPCRYFRRCTLCKRGRRA